MAEVLDLTYDEAVGGEKHNPLQRFIWWKHLILPMTWWRRQTKPIQKGEIAEVLDLTYDEVEALGQTLKKGSYRERT